MKRLLIRDLQQELRSVRGRLGWAVRDRRELADLYKKEYRSSRKSAREAHHLLREVYHLKERHLPLRKRILELEQGLERLKREINQYPGETPVKLNSMIQAVQRP